MGSYGPRWFQMSPNGFPQMVPGLQISPDASRCLQMLPDASRCLQVMTYILREYVIEIVLIEIWFHEYTYIYIHIYISVLKLSWWYGCKDLPSGAIWGSLEPSGWPAYWQLERGVGSGQNSYMVPCVGKRPSLHLYGFYQQYPYKWALARMQSWEELGLCVGRARTLTNT